LGQSLSLCHDALFDAWRKLVPAVAGGRATAARLGSVADLQGQLEAAQREQRHVREQCTILKKVGEAFRTEAIPWRQGLSCKTAPNPLGCTRLDRRKSGNEVHLAGSAELAPHVCSAASSDKQQSAGGRHLVAGSFANISARPAALDRGYVARMRGARATADQMTRTLFRPVARVQSPKVSPV